MPKHCLFVPLAPNAHPLSRTLPPSLPTSFTSHAFSLPVHYSQSFDAARCCSLSHSRGQCPKAAPPVTGAQRLPITSPEVTLHHCSCDDVAVHKLGGLKVLLNHSKSLAKSCPQALGPKCPLKPLLWVWRIIGETLPLWRSNCPPCLHLGPHCPHHGVQYFTTPGSPSNCTWLGCRHSHWAAAPGQGAAPHHPVTEVLGGRLHAGIVTQPPLRRGIVT